MTFAGSATCRPARTAAESSARNRIHSPGVQAEVGSIVEFIDARLREDENMARAVHTEPLACVAGPPAQEAKAAVREAEQTMREPERTVREVLSKRLIVALAQLPDTGARRERLLRSVALCWADHADYRPEWIL